MMPSGHPCRGLAVAASLMLVLLNGRPARAQSGLRWKVPDAVQRIDLGPDNRTRQIRLASEGLSIEVPVKFFMIGQGQVSIEAALPEAGRFDLKLVNDKALVEVRNMRVEGKFGRAEIVALAPPLSFDNAWEKTQPAVDAIQGTARQRAADRAKQLSGRELRSYLETQGEKAPDGEDKLRTAYAQAKADEETAPQFKTKVRELIDDRPTWYRRDVEDRLRQARVNARLLYQELAALDLAEDYLDRFGLRLSQRQPNYTAFADRVQARLGAVYQIVGGKTAQGEKRAVDASELAKLRQALLVDLECRLFPQADPQDPNSQWFAGQRIICQGSGIKTIKVFGRLDPANHDQGDWWILEQCSANIPLDTTRGDGYRIEPPLKAGERMALRVVATSDKAVDYSFQLTLKDRGMAITVYESPARADAKFPF